MAFIPKPTFPNVPNLPGVPQLRRAADAIIPVALRVLGSAAALGALWQSYFATPQWGVYDTEGNARLQPDNVRDMSLRLDSTVAGFPVAPNSFAAYNKVIHPDEIYLRMSKGGSQQDRANFISDAIYLQRSLGQFRVLTPERSHERLNLVRVEIHRRGAEGAYYLPEVDLFFQEIRESTAEYTSYEASTENAQDPSAQPSVNQGRVQGQTPPQGAQFDGSESLRVNP